MKIWEETRLDQKVKAAAEKFAALVEAQLARNERIKAQKEFTDYGKLDTIVIGVCGGDGIGPIITNEAARVLRHLLADVLDDYRENALLLEQSAEGCRSPAVAELAGVQRDYSKRMEELLRDRLPRLMHGEEDPQEERAEAAALFAEYAIDFAAQGVRSALLAALAAMDQQMNCEEQQGKEHPV